MEFYKIIFQLLAFIIIIYLVYYLYRYIIYAYRNKRLKMYTIKSKHKDNTSFELLDKITKKIAKNNNFYLKRKNKYDKYLLDNNITSYHVITLKLITSLLIGLIYIFDCMLYKLNLNIFLLIIIFILGYYVIDIILNIEYKTKISYMNYNISKVAIIMNNNYRLNKNHKEVIDKIIKEIDSPLKNEFKIVKNDLNKGLDISYAFRKMYERTKIDKILYISELLALNVKYGISIIDICDKLESDIARIEKKDFYLQRLINTNKLLIKVIIILPIFLLLLLYILNPSVITISYKKVIIIELIIYLSYILSIIFISRREI